MVGRSGRQDAGFVKLPPAELASLYGAHEAEARCHPGRHEPGKESYFSIPSLAKAAAFRLRVERWE